MTGPDADAGEHARRIYAADRVAQGLGMTLLAAGIGTATVGMTVRPDMANGHGICHGGYLFMLADSAFEFACNSRGDPTVAAGVSLEFIAPAHVGDRLVAVAREQWLGGRSGLYDIVVTRDDGAMIAQMRGRSHRVSRTLTP